ncbi:hypothetical protein AWE51_25265 [Aquimarina aggregata]|uniref:Outer membrane protein beta-barrel domain-containing protein n=1 Tax=Aquimarina aggregata TaxID=1642818 RepID=A0A162ZZG5_9FLAO|nr:hypothetical protein [Aquimarina aggregata]KZS40155.1 hypothetical protein AWE51_25265 [Aquimarina aggregata]
MYKNIFLGIILYFLTSSLIAQNQDKQASFGINIEISESYQFQESQHKGEPKELFIGLIFAPFAATTFEGDPPFSTDTSLFLTAALVKGDWSIAPYYNFGTNSAGAFLTYNILDELGTYVSSDKALTGNTGTYALGFTTPILEDYIQGYVEIGGTYGDDATAFFGVGLYFNILKSVKSW